ncbi:hypothetical protein AGMMS50293_18750 [Spirochaetia bacterium]|nr:hypothetical protein AGMMS50293_18750 [Spirochaetia bacterium]
MSFRRIFTLGIFIFSVFPAALFSQSLDQLLRKALREQDIHFEEGLVFSTGTENGDSDGAFFNNGENGVGGLSLLVRITPNRPQTSERDGAITDSPLFVLAVPIEDGAQSGNAIATNGSSAGSGAKNTLPFRFQTAIAFVSLIKNAVDRENFTLPSAILVIFLGYWDSLALDSASAVNTIDSGDILEPGNTLLWYFDSGEAPQSLKIYYRSAQAKAPLFMLKPLPGLCAFRGISFSLENRPAQSRGALEYAHAQEIDALYIHATGGAVGGSFSAETLAGLAAAYVSTLEYPGYDADHHYSLIALPGQVVFIPETAKVIFALLVLTAALGLGTAKIFRKRTSK